jgi:hypothetical protein
MEILELLILNERLVSELYSNYAFKFPEEKTFWFNKSSEENVHAEVLEGVRSIIEEIPSFFKKHKFDREALELSVANLKELIKKSSDHSIVEALAVAQDIENSLIEQEFFKVIATDLPPFKEAMLKLERDTKKHASEMQEKFRKYSAK